MKDVHLRSVRCPPQTNPPAAESNSVLSRWSSARAACQAPLHHSYHYRVLLRYHTKHYTNCYVLATASPLPPVLLLSLLLPCDERTIIIPPTPTPQFLGANTMPYGLGAGTIHPTRMRNLLYKPYYCHPFQLYSMNKISMPS